MQSNPWKARICHEVSQIKQKLGVKNMKQKYIKKPLSCIVVLLLPLVLCQCQSKESTQVQVVTQSDIAMGTLVSANIYTTGSEEEGAQLATEIFSKLKEVETSYISWREADSEAACINESAGTGESVEITGKMEEFLTQTLEIAQKSNGALDPTIGELSRLWDIDGEQPKVPTQEEILGLLKENGYKNVTCADQKIQLEENASIDLGAVGKGIGCDEAKILLTEHKEVLGAVISVGGSIVTYGSKEDNSPWGVAVTDPMYSGDNYMGVLSLEGENYVSTSGNYEKYFEQDGVRYHHILNPKTGYPAESGLVSVTVVAQNGLLSDGLSTACFVLGLTEGMQLIEEYQAEAVFIDENQNVYVSEGLKDKFKITKEDVYHLQ